MNPRTRCEARLVLRNGDDELAACTDCPVSLPVVKHAIKTKKGSTGVCLAMSTKESAVLASTAFEPE